MDDIGIYYDARHPSQLETLIANTTLNSDEQREAKRGLAMLREYSLSKYNHAPAIALPLRTATQRVPLIDQTMGDMSVTLGGADKDTFQKMMGKRP